MQSQATYRVKKPTKKQSLLLGKLKDNPGMSLYKAMVSVGYAPKTAQHPKKNLKGFQQLLDEYLPDDFLLQALEEDIKNKKGNRKGEIELALKVKGRLKNDGEAVGGTTIYNQTLNQQNIVDPNSTTARNIIDTSLQAMMEATKRKSA